MSYLVLARKWRPQTFEEVVGQESITKTLKNSIEKGRIPHAMLFTGMRGVGKTTAARVYAKALNCTEGPTKTPCNKCPNCQEITAGSSMDVLEIDGASNTGVNDIRELRENVRYLPSKSRYKIYIIDEVHMLSQSAFNALLKTLEEPPENVIFMFATTEPDDIPQTIISRCQRYDLKPITQQKLIESLKDICDKEKFGISDYSLGIVAREARGSMRDALSILDKLIAFGGDKISDEDIIEILGLVGRDILNRSVEAIIDKDTKGLLLIIDEIYKEGYDPRVFLSESLEYFRNLLVVRIDPKAKIPNLLEEDQKAMVTLSEKTSVEELQLIFDLIKDAYIEVGRSDYQRFILEMAMVRASSLTPLVKIDEIISELESKNEQTALKKKIDSVEPRRKQKVVASDGKKELTKDNVTREWETILDTVKREKPLVGVALSDAIPFMEGKLLKLGFEKPSFNFEKVSESENLDILKNVVSKNYANKPNVQLVVTKNIFKKKSESPDYPKKVVEDKKISDSKGDSAVSKALNILGGRIEGENLKNG